ncbi:hypothetical protein MAPG_09700 [Magnaporthiopsis poae ATCC 64411]|uniref:Uncharacterized protein n=1 Tax=Magnaporthiopsis poae (strain ATCC 64411 / 73-15) TaxID=644358 RepID=A0A0C4EAM5_MAGP6|nr:hypothetical protein MAPG_09700 [Magnaporthiopsis poae ATCC 64411]
MKRISLRPSTLCCTRHTLTSLIRSYTTKAGFAGDITPSLVFPSVVGQSLVGYEAQSDDDLKRPIVNGIIEDWDRVEALWKDVYSELDVSSAAHPVVLTDGLEGTRHDTERTTRVFFETLNVPSIYPGKRPTLCIHSVGREGGISVDPGHGATRIAHVFAGFALPLQTTEGVGGSVVSRHLEHLLRRTPAFRDGVPPAVLQDIKERLCRVSLDFQRDSREYKESEERPYELPDGQVVRLGKELFHAPEALFNPDIFDVQPTAQRGIPSAVAQTILKCDEDIRMDRFGQIVVEQDPRGGFTVSGPRCALRSLARLGPEKAKRLVVAPPRRHGVGLDPLDPGFPKVGYGSARTGIGALNGQASVRRR